MLIYESAAGRVAVVTGAASGIGEAIALRLAEDGFRVIIADSDAGGASNTAGRIASWGWSTDAVEMDVADPNSIDAAFAWIAQRYRRCDVLINAEAAADTTCAFVDLPLDSWQSALNFNVTGAMFCAQRAARLMIRAQWGRIVNFAPTVESEFARGRAAYATSRSAVLGLTRQMAVELAPHGITVNAIAPGAVQTVVSHETSTRCRSQDASNVPMARLARPQEIASTVAFLTSEEAAYVTGHLLPVDGGLVAAAGLVQA